MHRHSLDRPLSYRYARVARDGVTTVEFALVIGVFLFMLLAILDLSLIVLRQNSLAASAQRVARAAVVRGACAGTDAAWGPGSIRCRGGDRSPVAAEARKALLSINPRDAMITVTWPDGGNEPDERVIVRVAYPHRSMFPLLFGKNSRLQSESVMRIAH